MSQQNTSNFSNRSGLHISPLVMMTVVATSVLNPDGAIAHKVKTSSDVAATYHLEPNHNPKAGETATVWFALTKAGGQQIPFSACDCQLEVQQSGKSIATLPMKPIDAEQYQGIPGADVVFPAVGIYQLVFSGNAKDGQSFQPFELKYDVTVQPGQKVASSPSKAAAQLPKVADANVSQSNNWLLPGFLALGAAIALCGAVWVRRDRPGS